MNRPTSVTVFGALNLVFGGMGFFCLALSAVTWLLPMPQAQGNPVLDLMQKNETYALITKIGTGLGLVASVVLLAAGVGLLKMKTWGRLLSIVYAVYAISMSLIMLGVNWVFLIQPLIDEANKLPPGPERAGIIGGAFGSAVGGCFGPIYPVFLLVFMLLPSTRAAFERANTGDSYGA